MKTINWEKESNIINIYSDWKVKPTKESVLDYIKTIVEINGVEELYSNEKKLFKLLKKLEVE